MRVVLDTNIYISAICFGGKSEKVLNLAREKKIELLISEEIKKEIIEILSRKFNFNNHQIFEVLKDIESLTTLIIPKIRLKVIGEDSNDNRVLECAVEGKAQYIVSGDEKHILPLKEYQGIKILRATEFLNLFLKR
jgi:putative PIN family toxin of toxin-antitoxin system